MIIQQTAASLCHRDTLRMGKDMPRWRPGEPSTPACFPVSWLRNCYKYNGLTFQWISDSCGWLCNRCSATTVKMSWTLHDIVTIASTQIAKATPHRFQCSNCSTELLLNVVAACSKIVCRPRTSSFQVHAHVPAVPLGQTKRQYLAPSFSTSLS